MPWRTTIFKKKFLQCAGALQNLERLSVPCISTPQFLVCQRITISFVFHLWLLILFTFQIPLKKRNCAILSILCQIKNLPEGITAQIFRYCLIIFACQPNIARGIWVKALFITHVSSLSTLKSRD